MKKTLLLKVRSFSPGTSNFALTVCEEASPAVHFADVVTFEETEEEKLDPRKEFTFEDTMAMVAKQEERCKRMARKCESSWNKKLLKAQQVYWHDARKVLLRSMTKKEGDSTDLQRHYALHAAIEGESYDRAFLEQRASRLQGRKATLSLGYVYGEIEQLKGRVRILESRLERSDNTFGEPPRTGVDILYVFRERLGEGYEHEEEKSFLGLSCPMS